MFFSRRNAILLTSYLLATSSVLGAPIRHQRREVPQEHSHEKYLTSVRASLNLDNPDGIVDPVFGLLGNAAAATGQGQITDTDCLHLATADRALTNAKAAGDVQAQVDALIFGALERNTGAIGQASVLCTAITPVNSELAAFTQIQDPASDGAAEGNKKTILALAVEIAKLGGDPLQALDASTFKPGTIGDPTGKGNTCDDANDPEGCIFTQNLIDIQVTEDEINAAVSDAGAGGADASASASDVATATDAATATATDAADTATATDCVETVTVTQTITSDAAEATATDDTATCEPSTVTVTVTAGSDSAATATATSAAAAATTSAAAAAAGGANLQTFTGALGDITAPAVTNIGGDRPFSVEGNATFNSLSNALQRSCDVQHNKCANAANAAGQNAAFSVGDCGTQQDECGKVAQAAARR